MNVTRIKEPLTLLRKYVETYHVAINSSKQSLVNGNFSMILQAFGKLIDCLSVLSITKVINADTLTCSNISTVTILKKSISTLNCL
ncbi:hypothetical protein AX774_g8138 [Zancudomyces culisetae]|uniref:Uncharacterized protein n=1 Tax=Zancudomyces culisetae TaxID=1213189 RepID=A0A1R1PCA1_ZANCU|nr:hypothetical protein AX774_g8138 [Zancudomyces culisetae]|eukprot:OMH78482.1 hypothetical protein AX774_g8138 [Zancudomyces culisetae]